MTAVDLKPTTRAQRISSLDTIRGVALLGILLMNIAGMGLSHAYSDPTVSGGFTGWNLTAWWATTMLFEGTMRGMFSMLFGAGVILFTSRSVGDINGVSVTDAYFRRVSWLVVFGMVHAYLLLWIGDILYAYGLVGFFVYSFRNLDAKKLIIVAFFALVGAFLINYTDYATNRNMSLASQEAKEKKEAGQELTEEETGAIEGWEAVLAEAKPPQEVIDKDIASRHKGYFSVVASQSKVAQFLETMIMYRYFFFDIFAMMILGMAFFKLGIFQAERSNGFYLIMLLVGYGVGLTINYFETVYIVEHDFEIVATGKASLSYDVGRVATTFGHVALIMLFVKSGLLGFLQRALAAVGQMALSNYISHTLITTTIFIFFKQFGAFERYELYYIVFGIWIFQLIMSPIWLKYFRFGPLEWGWRTLTYWERQPFRRD
ncbi:DUF418 domain-containing protein [Reichenbachiella ulvae]|uniref:DUF418 domain-containing protein n=1 Tax=Reichenbachiella ulvae TaxID=2980104 RepID=A0ABT3CU45_9BACT|nr:DUF418 domain-containing protein [Reichenbachiella ulvae]MCV9387000.1 DUF418 domain-containing protein [Reichenbachiella ulvae]